MDGGQIAKSSEVQKELEMLKKENIALETLLTTLETKLSSITQPINPLSPTDKLNPTESTIVPLAETIRTERKYITTLKDKVQSILSRLEI